MLIQGLFTLGGLVLSIQRFHLWRLQLDIYHKKSTTISMQVFPLYKSIGLAAANFFLEHITYQFVILTKLQATNKALFIGVLLYQAVAIPRTLFKVVVVPYTILLESQRSYSSHRWDLCKHHLTLRDLVSHYLFEKTTYRST